MPEGFEASKGFIIIFKSAGLIPWRDKDVIKGGQNWKISIRKGIKNS